DQPPGPRGDEGRRDHQRPAPQRGHLHASNHRRPRTPPLAGESRPSRVHDLEDVADAVLQGQALRRRDWRCGRVPTFAERTIAMIGTRPGLAWCVVSVIGVLSLRVHGQVTSDRLAAAPSEPQNWLTYSGNYSSTRYSPLNQITPANVKSLKLQWVYQSPSAGNWQRTPLVVDGMMYITQRLNDVVALDAATGRAFWIYRYTPAQDRVVCCGANNRGLAILGDTLFMGTLDAQLIAIDRRTGRVIWKTEVATTKYGYSITHAPIIVQINVI